MEPGAFDGGVEASTWGLVEGLRQISDIEIHVVTLDPDAGHPRVLEWEGVTVHYLSTPRRLLTITYYFVPRRRIAAALRGIEPDLVHAQNSQMYGDICLGLPYPVVVSVHGVVAEELRHVSGWAERGRRKLQRRIQERVLARAPHLIQPGRFLENYHGDLVSGRWHTSWNPVADDFFEALPEAEPGRIFFAGAVTRLKRVLDLVEAVARLRGDLPDVRLRIAGSSREPDYLNRVRARVFELGLDEQVDFLGLLGRRALIDEYRRCAVFVLPSSHEISPMVVGEAMAVGVPVVASRVGGVDQLVEHGVTGLLYDAGDIDLLVRHLTTALTDNGLATDLRSNARATALERFSTVVVARTVLDVYRTVIEDHA